MATCDYKDLTCTSCKGSIPKGSMYTGSFQRPRHYAACPAQPTKPAPHPPRVQQTRPAIRRQSVVLDSYEQECEDEGIKMGYRSY